jgi:catechol 2,3-dioxygenase-like lactoylglutathione lyase family enzyme
VSSVAVQPQKFHFGLTVNDLSRAVDFYRVLFDTPPAKQTDDYVKFDVDDPPLVLALHPGRRGSGGALNHVGFRVRSSEALVAVQRRLEERGIATQREEGVECCYSRQTKFWVPDADHNLWEVYTLEEDLDHSGFGGGGQGMPPRELTAQSVTWTHMLTAPPPSRIPHEDATVDEVLLEGTFNAALPAGACGALLAEALRVLKPGGSLSVHGLVSDKPFPGRPSLPGPAALVQAIPVETAPLDALRAAGFVGLFYQRLGDIHCFSVNGVELRELQLVGYKPAGPAALDEQHAVMYHGPLARLVDEQGRSFPRGQRVAVDAATWNLLSHPPLAECFTCFS